MYDDTDTTWETYPLGDDTDCETCGGSYNEVSLVIDEDTQRPGKKLWSVSIRVGCFGGDSVHGYDTENISEKQLFELEELFVWARKYPLWEASYESEIRQQLGLPTSP